MFRKILGLLALMATTGAVSANATTNAKADLLRCEVSVFNDLGGGSSESHPVTVLIADGKDPHSEIGFKYSKKEYLLTVGVENLIATKGMSATTVAIVRGTKVLASVDSADLVARMKNGTYSWEAKESDKVPMASGEQLFIRCSGRSERSQLINNSNTIEALSEKVFGATSN